MGCIPYSTLRKVLWAAKLAGPSGQRSGAGLCSQQLANRPEAPRRRQEPCWPDLRCSCQKWRRAPPPPAFQKILCLRSAAADAGAAGCEEGAAGSVGS